MVEGLLQMRAITDAASDMYMEHLFAQLAFVPLMLEGEHIL